MKSGKKYLKKNYFAKNLAQKRRDKTTLCSARDVTINGSTMPFLYIEALKSEFQRLATFATFPDLPKEGFFLKCARAGWFYSGNGDRLTCYSCCLTLGNWTANDDPMELHQEHSPLCDFICQRNNNGNIPITGNGGDSGFRCTFCGCDRDFVARYICWIGDALPKLLPMFPRRWDNSIMCRKISKFEKLCVNLLVISHFDAIYKASILMQSKSLALSLKYNSNIKLQSYKRKLGYSSEILKTTRNKVVSTNIL
ncbi:hypothetical protein KUTeg_018638 [Tegillarca granosa]|uniref:Uncharacterized protein n=1 Tax=Tegillarca granosa TaxID=220873 RepID=A0ABQ9EK86_TEGGR|nr:hypothetical protein KUTeg_018638 [Tegillarca granosa]